MTYGGGLITVVAEETSNHVTPALSTSQHARCHCQLYYLRPKIYYRNVRSEVLLLAITTEMFRYKMLFLAVITEIFVRKCSS